MRNANKIASFIEYELSSDLQDVLVTQDNTGKYYLFNRYVIVTLNNYCKVYCLQSGEILDFSSLKSATAWCILHNAGKHSYARILKRLDSKLISIALDIAIHKNMIKTTKDSFVQSVSINKLQEDTYKRRMILAELNDYINTSKQIQDKNFRIKDSKISFAR